MAGQVFHDCSTLTWAGTDIAGATNRVVLNRSRAPVSWANFGDDSMNRDADVRDESITVDAVYAEGAAAAQQAVLDSYEASDGGGEGTLVCTPISGGTTYTAVGKITDAPTTIAKGEVGSCSFTVSINGTISRS